MAIHSLSEDTVSQIAAGEVIERPSSIVKELAENSLDSGASHIEVSFNSQALSISCKDNGSGIAREDLAKAPLPHATSKIRSASDLWKVQTYGFRGEALSSIIAISSGALISKAKGGKAYRLKFRFGSIEEIEETGAEHGTTVIAGGIFENTPARLKFLKSRASESAAIKNVIKAMALARPQTGFKLIQNGKLACYFPKGQSFMERARGALLTDELYHASAQRGGLSFEAAFAPPHQTSKTKKDIWLFANGRYVEDRALHASLQAAYRGLLMHGERPRAALKIDLPPGEIDVNAHPAKTEVRFKNSRAVFQIVESSVRAVLEQAPWTKALTGRAFFPSASGHAGRQRAAADVARQTRAGGGGGKEAMGFLGRFGQKSQGGNFRFSDPALQKTHFSKGGQRFSAEDRALLFSSDSADRPCGAEKQASPPLSGDGAFSLQNSKGGEAPQTAPSSGASGLRCAPVRSKQEPGAAGANLSGAGPSMGGPLIGETRSDRTAHIRSAAADSSSRAAQEHAAGPRKVWSSLQILAQAQLTYLVCQSDRALIFIDQHAAAERILYERLFALWRSGQGHEVQTFLTPLRLDMEEDEAEALLSLASYLKKAGIRVEALGISSVGVSAGPAILKESALEEGLRFLAKNFIETQDSFSFERALSRLFASMACHSAIRAGQPLSLPQMEELLNGMDEFPLSSFCPHGRPVFVEYPISRLERDFGRTL